MINAYTKTFYLIVNIFFYIKVNISDTLGLCENQGDYKYVLDFQSLSS